MFDKTYFVIDEVLRHKQQQQKGGVLSVNDSPFDTAINLLSPSMQLMQYR